MRESGSLALLAATSTTDDRLGHGAGKKWGLNAREQVPDKELAVMAILTIGRVRRKHVSADSAVNSAMRSTFEPVAEIRIRRFFMNLLDRLWRIGPSEHVTGLLSSVVETPRQAVRAVYAR